MSAEDAQRILVEPRDRGRTWANRVAPSSDASLRRQAQTSRDPSPTGKNGSLLTDHEVEMLVESFPHLTTGEVRGLARLFMTWDDDGNYELSIDEMRQALDNMSRALFDECDTEHDGRLGKADIVRLSDLLGQKLSSAEVNMALSQMDLDDSGSVSFEEFESWWREWNGFTTNEELEDLFAEVDADKSGEIDIYEFINMIGKKTPEGPSAAYGMPHRTPVQMVRIAIDCVREDARAIYGATRRPKSAWELSRDLEKSIETRKCFWTSGTNNRRRDRCRRHWDIVQVFMLFYVAIFIPYRVGFGKPVKASLLEWMFWVEVVVDLYFIVDIIVNFRTGFLNGEGELVVVQRDISRAYLRSWFFIDVAACLPVTYVGLILGGGTEGSQLKALKIVRLLRLAKMLRLAKLKAVIKRVDAEFPGIFTVSKLSAIVLVILYVSHLFSCGWYWVGSLDMVRSDGLLVRGWVAGKDGDPMQWNQNVSYVTRYLDAYYYAITTLTTVGYGDRVPRTDAEKLFAIATELAGGMIFGILAGTLSAMVTEQNAAEAKVEEQMDHLKEFMIRSKTAKPIRHDIMTSMTDIVKHEKGDEKSIMAWLPPKHKKTLLLSTYKPLLVRCPLFHGLEETIINKASMRMHPYHAVPGDVIVEENEVGNEMFMVVRGEVVLNSRSCDKFNGRSWVDGAFFGELPLLELGKGELRNRHVYDVTAVVTCELIYLTRDDIRDLEADFPAFKSHVGELAERRALRFGLAPSQVARMSAETYAQRMRTSSEMDLARIEEHGETAQQQTKPEQETQIPGRAPRPPLPGAHKRGGDGGGGGRIAVNAERERAAGGSRNELALLSARLAEVEAHVTVLPRLERGIERLQQSLLRLELVQPAAGNGVEGLRGEVKMAKFNQDALERQSPRGAATNTERVSPRGAVRSTERNSPRGAIRSTERNSPRGGSGGGGEP